jgi:hypothetical protein
VGGFIAAAIAAGVGFSSWPAGAAIFLGFTAITYFSFVVDMSVEQSKWWQI